MYDIAHSQLPSVEQPWRKFYSKKVLAKALPTCTVYDRLKNAVADKNLSNVIALDYFGVKTSYAQFLERIEQYAAAFCHYGIREGDFVTIVSACIPETYYMLYALNYIGAVCNMIDPRTDAPHIREFTEEAKSEVLIVIENMWDKVAELSRDMKLVIVQSPADSLPLSKRIVYNLKTQGKRVSFDSKNTKCISCKTFAAAGIDKKAVKAVYKKDMPAFITRTGGTTGTSKGVVLTNDNVNIAAANCSEIELDAHPGETLLDFIPVSFSYGIVCSMHVPLTMGGTCIMIPKLDADDFPVLIAKHRPNYIFGVPVFYEKLMNSPLVKDMELSFIRMMGAGGDTLNAALQDKLEEFGKVHHIPYPLAQGYGLSETSSPAAFGVQNIYRRGSVGIPCLFNNIGIFKPDTDEEIGYNKEGEICISGPTLMLGYLNKPDETANIIRRHSDGVPWLHSGDLGYLDEDGFLYITGRMKRSVIRFDGHKSYPAQIETVIMKHKDVENCCVIPAKDIDHPQGELPLAIIQLSKQSNANQDTLRKEIFALCKANIEERSQPAGIVFVDSIPISLMGKNDYKKLCEMYGTYRYK